jgi:hypothetical protein
MTPFCRGVVAANAVAHCLSPIGEWIVCIASSRSTKASLGEPRETVVPTIYRPIFERVGRDATLKESVLLHPWSSHRPATSDVRHGLAELGGIDIFVNNAAHQASFKSLRTHNRQPPCSGPLVNAWLRWRCTARLSGSHHASAVSFATLIVSR